MYTITRNDDEYDSDTMIGGHYECKMKGSRLTEDSIADLSNVVCAN